jgi:2-oxoglutarate dehydrogenase E1 component
VTVTTANISEFIRENFGANASYVEGLLARYRTDPNLVDESWQTYFEDLLKGDGSAATAQEPAAAAPVKTQPAVKTPEPAAKPVAVTLGADTESKPLIGPAKKIVENMEQSLTVPSATSSRNIPVKILEENRRVMNAHLASRGLGKISFTHIIAWAIVKAIKDYPHMNFGYGVVAGVPSRLEHAHVNIGLAIDIEKKDGSRSLLVPNIKAADTMTFKEFFAAYNETVRKAREGELVIEDFQGTTISLTNPGTLGTVSSAPRLMSGQSAIIATGAIEYPA